MIIHAYTSVYMYITHNIRTYIYTADIYIHIPGNDHTACTHIIVMVVKTVKMVLLYWLLVCYCVNGTG